MSNVMRPEILRTTMRETVRYEFRSRFGVEPLLVRSPGRINLMGDHTDYNGGLALVGAVDRAVWLAVAPRHDERVRIVALSLHKTFEGELRAPPREPGEWPRYLLGEVDLMRTRGWAIRGFDLVYGTDIPNGAGLSSSTALSCGLAYALSRAFNLEMGRAEIASVAHSTEERYVGTRCGRMDETAILGARPNQLIYMDFRNTKSMHLPFTPEKEVRLVLCNSGVERTSSGERYNTRRAHCETGVAIVRKYRPGIQSLRDVHLEDLVQHRAEIDPVVFRRCAFVLAENERVVHAAIAIRQHDLAQLGKLMYESHEGLRRQYEISCHDIDVLVRGASSFSGTLGARMMGSGFGGSTINLVRTADLKNFMEHMSVIFRERLGRSGCVIACSLAAGTE